LKIKKLNCKQSYLFHKHTVIFLEKLDFTKNASESIHYKHKKNKCVMIKF